MTRDAEAMLNELCDKWEAEIDRLQEQVDEWREVAHRAIENAQNLNARNEEVRAALEDLAAAVAENTLADPRGSAEIH